MAEVVWTQWESRTVNGIYPLRRFLSASDHSAVFLTESTTEGFLNAAVKLIPAEPGRTDVQLWQWKTATTFSHPHLIRLLDSGVCEIDGRHLLFVVMEYAEENLSQVLPYRGLAPDEVSELLVPTLEALTVLHRENWVQGQLKPTNFLVVNDQLKLAMDTIRSASVAGEALTRPTIYDPPEAELGETTLAADIWALGVTLVEALTQYPPTWPQGKTGAPSLPPNLPPVFLEIIQRCLSVNPAERPSIAELQALTRPGAMPASASAPAPTPTSPATAPAVAPQQTAPPQVMQQDTLVLPQVRQAEPVMRAVPPHSSSSKHSTRAPSGKRGVSGTVIAALVVICVVVWGGWRIMGGSSTSKPADSVAQTSPQEEAPQAQGADAAPPEETPPAAPVAATPPDVATARGTTSAGTGTKPHISPLVPERSASSHPSRSGSGSAAVVHEEIPTASPGARQTIRGHVRVSVRVTVNRSGNVVNDTFENASSSKYFNKLASDAARKWKFTSADNDHSREWLLHFEFGRDGTTVHATPSRS